MQAWHPAHELISQASKTASSMISTFQVFKAVKQYASDKYGVMCTWEVFCLLSSSALCVFCILCSTSMHDQRHGMLPSANAHMTLKTGCDHVHFPTVRLQSQPLQSVPGCAGLLLTWPTWHADISSVAHDPVHVTTHCACTALCFTQGCFTHCT